MNATKGRDSNSSPRLTNLCHVTEGTLRVAPLFILFRLLADHGVNVDAVIREIGCEPALFRDPENAIGFSTVGRLLVHAAEVSALPYPGLEFGSLAGLEVLGMLGEAIRLAPDVGTALRALILYFHLHDRGAIPSLWESRDFTMFGYTLYCPDTPGVDHIYDAALAISHNVLSELVGKQWKSTEVHMFREPPADIAPFRRHFGSRLRFRTEHAAIVFPTDYLARPLPSADPGAYAKAISKLENMDGANDASLFENKVRRVLYRKLIGGRGPYGIDLDEIAQLFELHPRTLNRRLRAEGTTFITLLNESRCYVAQQLLRDTHLQIAEIAFLLGYAESASFNHAFRRWTGIAASRWRSSNRLD